MNPALGLRQSVIDRFEEHGLEFICDGPIVTLINVPLPEGFSARVVDLRVKLEGGLIDIFVPASLEYVGDDPACARALSGRRRRTWRHLELAPEASRDLKAALCAALTSLASPASGLLSLPREESARREGASSPSALQQFATLLTPVIQAGRFPAVVERDDELDFIEDSLVQRSHHARVVALYGDVGSGRWTVGAVGLGQRIGQGECRPELAGRLIYALNPATIAGGVMMVGELEHRLEQIAQECSAGGHILVIPDRAIDVLRWLPPIHDLRIVARATPPELKSWLMASPSQVAQATLVRLEPSRPHASNDILSAHVGAFCEHYGLAGVPAPIIADAVELADDTVPGVLPGSAVKLLDQTCAVASRRVLAGGAPYPTRDDLLKAIGRLSGGEQADILLNRWFSETLSTIGDLAEDPNQWDEDAHETEAENGA